MAINYTIAQHAVAAPAKVLASQGGKHIYNVKLTSDVDNGNFVARGAWQSLDLYAQAAAAGMEGIVREQAANGNYYVEITKPGTALFVYNVPMIAEEWTNKFKKESNFYNKSGEIVRAYELAEGDIVEISKEGFTAVPSVGDTVQTSGLKLAKKSGQ